MIRQNEIDEIKKIIATRNIIILGKTGVGKTFIMNELANTLPANETIVFPEPPTAKTLLTAITGILKIKPKRTKDEIIEDIKNTQSNTIYVLIDTIEKTTPSIISTIDSLMDMPHIRLILAGHLGKKKSYNSTWLKAKGYFLKELDTAQSIKLIETLWNKFAPEHKKLIAEKSNGNPRKIIAMIDEAKQGILPEETINYFDFMPILLIIGTVGLAIRVIGYGYSSMEQYIIGGIIAALFWGGFWIYRGYISGWFGGEHETKK